MIKLKKILIKLFIAVITFTAIFVAPTFAAKYTIANGKDFNARIKLHLDQNSSSASPEYTILGFDFSTKFDGDLIDVSEDGDSSVLAYIKNNIIYVVCEEEIFLNEDASYMFDKFVNIRKINLSEMNFKKTKKANFMFGNCKYLTDINLDNDTQINLNEMQGMFFDCQSLVDANIFMINTKNVRSMNSLFCNCKNLKNINVTPNYFKVNNLMDYANMYTNCLLLRTNFGRNATDIDPSLYIKYTICGDDDKEGLLKDVDYEYDDYGKNSGSIKPDVISETLLSSAYNTNSISLVNSSFLQNSKSLSEVKIATDSIFYDNVVDTYYDKNGHMRFSDKKLSETVDEIPILIADTTSVERLIPKDKRLLTSTNSIVSEELNTASYSNIKGMLRPSYDDGILESTTVLTTSEETTDTMLSNNATKSIDFEVIIRNIIIILSVILIIVLGVVYYNYKNNKDNSDNL